MTKRNAIHTVLFTVALALVASTLPRAAEATPSAMRERVLANIAASKQARASSNFKQFAAYERNGFRNMPRPAAPRRTTSYGPTKVPHNFVVYGGGGQPDTVFDKSSKRVKRDVRRKAAKLRMNTTMKPWDKIERIQKVIRQKVKHAGNELDVTKNPNRYNKYNKKMKSAGKLANLGDYLKMHSVVCREFAFLTQVALEDAGLEARLVRGDIYKGGKRIGGHAWNEVKIDGKWQMVDTTNPQFNKTDPQVARTQGTPNGWKWDRDDSWFKVGPAEKHPSRSRLGGYWR